MKGLEAFPQRDDLPALKFWWYDGKPGDSIKPLRPELEVVREVIGTYPHPVHLLRRRRSSSVLAAQTAREGEGLRGPALQRPRLTYLVLGMLQFQRPCRMPPMAHERGYLASAFLSAGRKVREPWRARRLARLRKG